MSTEPNPTEKSDRPDKPAPVVAETAATEFLASELEQARKSCRRTRAGGIIAALVVLTYMSFVTSRLTQYLEPKTAASLANVFIGNQVTEKASELSSQLKTRIPELIAELPTFLMQQLPEYRMAFEKKIEVDFGDYCHQTSRQMAKHFDDYLDAHSVQIRAVLAASQDRHALKELGPDIEQTLLEYLQDKGDDGESIKDKIDKSLEALRRIETQVDRLANGKDLTPQEKKTRRVIAMISKAVEEQQPDWLKATALPLPKQAAPAQP